MPRSFLFMRVHISVILCDYIFHYIRAFFPLTWYISIFCLPLQLGSQYSLTQFELRLKWTAVDVFGECFWCFCHLIALVVSRSDALSLFHSNTHSLSLDLHDTAITYLFIRPKITKHNLSCQLFIFAANLNNFPWFVVVILFLCVQVRCCLHSFSIASLLAIIKRMRIGHKMKTECRYTLYAFCCHNSQLFKCLRP